MWKHEGNVETLSISTTESCTLAAIAVNSRSCLSGKRHIAERFLDIAVNSCASISVLRFS